MPATSVGDWNTQQKGMFRSSFGAEDPGLVCILDSPYTRIIEGDAGIGKLQVVAASTVFYLCELPQRLSWSCLVIVSSVHKIPSVCTVKGSEELQQLGLCDLQGVIFLTSSALVSPL